tara:strand:+ start:2145 stop:2696 length:552 start_codon:yes stop_codon:yes gene_type:complete
MNEEAPTMSAGTGGFSSSANAKGPVAGLDPVIQFRGKIKKKKKALKETTTCPRDSQKPSKLFQYKINVPEVGETIVYANSPAELRMKLRMAIMPKYRSGINIERIMPGGAAKFFMDKRMKHMKNIQTESANDQQMKNQMNQQKIQNMKKKVMLKKQELQKQLQLKTQQLKKQARTGVEQDATR